MSGELTENAGGLFPAGSRVAQYRLEEQVGAGGMAVVFRAVDERLGRPVALKVMAPGLASDEEFRYRFVRESRALAAVDDPHIIPVYEAGEAGGVLFIAMRYVPGGDVRGLLRRKGLLPPARVSAVVSSVASALDAAHAAGLVHRDVKPANMLLDMRPGRPDHVYLSDFGLSKRVLSSAGVTGVQQFLGTPDYTAPEQIEGKPVDGRADQYALACAGFEMLTGRPPFQRDDASLVLWAHLGTPPPPLTELRPELPAAVDEVLARAMAKSPADRYVSCMDFSGAFRAALGLASHEAAAATVPAADLAALCSAAAKTLVALMPTDSWERVKAGFAELWRRNDPARAGTVEADLQAARTVTITAVRDGDAEAVADLAAEWRSRLRRLSAADDAVPSELGRLVAEFGPLLAGSGPASPVVMTAWASGGSRINQAGGDQTVIG